MAQGKSTQSFEMLGTGLTGMVLAAGLIYILPPFLEPIGVLVFAMAACAAGSGLYGCLGFVRMIGSGAALLTLCLLIKLVLDTRAPALPVLMIIGILMVIFALVGGGMSIFRKASAKATAARDSAQQLARERAHLAELNSPVRSLASVAPAREVFSGGLATKPSRPLPAVKGKWTTMAEDHDALTNHARYLDACKDEGKSLVERTVDRYKTDHAYVLTQRKEVIKRAFQAKRHIVGFSGMPPIELGLDKLAQFSRLDVPRPPAYLTAGEFAKRYALIPDSTGAALGRALTQNGVRGDPAAVAAVAVISLGAMAINAKASISRGLRALADNHGKIERFVLDANQNAVLLGAAHEKLTAASAMLSTADGEIAALAERVSALPRKYGLLSSLNPADLNDVHELYYWIMAADEAARRNI